MTMCSLYNGFQNPAAAFTKQRDSASPVGGQRMQSADPPCMAIGEIATQQQTTTSMSSTNLRLSATQNLDMETHTSRHHSQIRICFICSLFRHMFLPQILEQPCRENPYTSCISHIAKDFASCHSAYAALYNIVCLGRLAEHSRASAHCRQLLKPGSRRPWILLGLLGTPRKG